GFGGDGGNWSLALLPPSAGARLSRRVTAFLSSVLVLTSLLVAARHVPSARAETPADEGVVLAAGDVASCLAKPGDEAPADRHTAAPNANCAANVAKMTPSNPDGCSGSSVQGKWLKADLAAHATQCMIAMWHEPRFFSVAVPDVTMPGYLQPSSDPTMDDLW